MTDPRAAGRYAHALFNLAEEDSSLERVDREFSEAVERVRCYPEISNLLRNTTLSREEKEDFASKVFPKEFSSLLINFIKVLVRKKRLGELSGIQEQFHHLYQEKEGVQPVRVESPVPLGKTLEEKLCSVLGKKLNRKIILDPVVKPELLGGLVLDFEGNQIDASYRTVLQELKQSLLKREG